MATTARSERLVVRLLTIWNSLSEPSGLMSVRSTVFLMSPEL